MLIRIPAADMLRLRWNPFYPYVESRVLELLGLDQGGRILDSVSFQRG